MFTVHSLQLTVEREMLSTNRLPAKALASASQPFTLSNVEGLTVKCKSKGFTIIELVVVMGIFALIISFVSINLIKPQVSATLNSSTNTVVADIKEQQIKAMVGDSEASGNSQTYGVHFESDRYILFRSSYSPSEPSNFTVNLNPGLSLSTTPQEIIFLKRSGETTATSITLTHSQTGEQKTLSINKVGAISIN